MKITTFNPLIITKDPEYAIKVFEALGFKRHHTKEGIGINNVTDVRMKDANGFHLDISQGDGEWTMIRMNVDDLEEGMIFPTAGEGFGAPGKSLNKGISNAYNNLLCLLLMVTPQNRREANEKIILEYYKDMKTILDYWKVTDISQATDEQVQAAADQIRERMKKDE